MTPFVLLPGRLSPEAKGVREAAIASGRRYSEGIARAGGVALTVSPLDSTPAHSRDVATRRLCVKPETVATLVAPRETLRSVPKATKAQGPPSRDCGA